MRAAPIEKVPKDEMMAADRPRNGRGFKETLKQKKEELGEDGGGQGEDRCYTRRNNNSRFSSRFKFISRNRETSF